MGRGLVTEMEASMRVPDTQFATTADNVNVAYQVFGEGPIDVVYAQGPIGGLVDRLAPDIPLLSGEVAYAIEHADAVHLSDVVLRRTSLGSAGHPGPAALERAATIMAERLGWSDERRAQEIALVEEIYPRY